MNPAVSSAAPTTTGFYSQIRGLIFLVLELWARWSILGLGPLASEVSLPIFIYHMWMWDCLFRVSREESRVEGMPVLFSNSGELGLPGFRVIRKRVAASKTLINSLQTQSGPGN